MMSISSTVYRVEVVSSLILGLMHLTGLLQVYVHIGSPHTEILADAYDITRRA